MYRSRSLPTRDSSSVLVPRAPSSFGTPLRLFLKARSEDEGDLKIRQKVLLAHCLLDSLII